MVGQNPKFLFVSTAPTIEWREHTGKQNQGEIMSNEPMNATIDSNDENENDAVASGGKQTPLNPADRKTGSGTSMETQEGAGPEAPGARSETPGSPNQGTESR